MRTSNSKTVTCINRLDKLLNPLPEKWIIEFYGRERDLWSLMHRSIACLSRKGNVAVLVVQDFGGFNPYLVEKFARILGGDVSRIIVSRVFDRETTSQAGSSIPEDVDYFVIIDPFLYGASRLDEYWVNSRISGMISKVFHNGRSVLVFNRATRYGSHYLPEGGSLHHHIVHVLVRVKRLSGKKSLLVELVKHSFRRESRMILPLVEVDTVWVEQPLLLEWLSTRK